MITTLNWDKSDSNCPNITYTINQVGGVLNTDLFKFDNSSRELSVYTVSANYVKVYSLYIEG